MNIFILLILSLTVKFYKITFSLYYKFFTIYIFYKTKSFTHSTCVCKYSLDDDNYKKEIMNMLKFNIYFIFLYIFLFFILSISREYYTKKYIIFSYFNIISN